MRVTSSAATNGRTVSVELEESDVHLSDVRTSHAKHQKMMVEADTMVVRYLLESDQISNEYAQARLAEIQSRSARVPT